MTGPPLPRLTADSNAIGNFQIGVSPIGDIPPFDYWLTVISQYANSPILMQLVTNFSAYVDQTHNMEAFFDLIWNVDTAEGYGLDVWGRIVGIDRTIDVDPTDYFGGEEGQFNTFNNGPFWSGTPANVHVAISDDMFRRLIFAKALANISSGTIPAINQLLINLFPFRGNCYVIDNGSMSLTYAFEFALSGQDTAILNSGVLPKPTGVRSTIASNLPAGVTFDPGAHGTLTTLSADRLTALVGSNPSLSYQGARSNWFHDGDKTYFEMRLIQRMASNVIRIGVGAANAIRFTSSGTAGGYNLGDAASGTLGIGYDWASGSIMLGGVAVGTLTAGTLGDVIGVAVNRIDGLIWFRRQGGLWNNDAGADPAFNLGGISIASLPGPVYAWLGIQESGATQVQANFGGAIYQSPAPNGYRNF